MKKLFSKYNLCMVKESSNEYEVNDKVNTPERMYDVAENVFRMSSNAEEVLLLMCLDIKNKIIGSFEVCRGSINSSIVHPREVLKRAILCNASYMIMVHNHPSGDPEPSPEDLKITKTLYDCGELIGIELVDHIVVGDNKFVSLKVRGVI